ncbi:MAG: hypothetical protein V3V33_06055, partial [Candidatus Lokiarchaeia archaeon]
MSLLNFNQFFWNSNNSITDSDSFTESQLFNEPKTSDYSSDYSGTGENMSITLHQSYLDESFNTILNTSIVDGNNFTLPCPKDIYFNSSYAKFEVEDIIAPNKTLKIGDESVLSDSLTLYGWGFSFYTKGNGFLENFTLLFSETNPAVKDGYLSIELMSAIWESQDQCMKPNSYLGDIILNYKINNDVVSVWYNFTNLDVELDTTQTNNNTFFIYIYQTTSTDVDIKFHYEADSGNNDDSTVWKRYSGGWATDPSAYDPSLSIDLTPLNNTPRPDQVNLRINNETVNKYNDIDNTGYLESFEVNGSASEKLHYNISADWWDVECTISQVQINYTKTDLEASSEFNIAGIGLNVDWTVTAGNFDHFTPTFGHYWINFTVPAKWSNFEAFNDTVDLTDNATLGPPEGGYMEYQIYNASNGPKWYITADSSNLLTSINSLGIFNYSDSAHFDAEFSTEISDGIINLSVYSPASINNEFNHSIRLISFTAGSVISLPDWDIFDNVTQYGDFRVHVYWNNNTAAGFQEKIIRILGETNLIPSLPAYKFDASDSFDLDLFFNDTGLDQGIEADSITYRIENGVIRSDAIDLTNGNYRIVIDCNDTDFNGYGPKSIEINASKTYYNNQSEVVQITILGETDLDSSIPKFSFDSTESFNVSLFFNDTVKDIGVFGATYTVYVNSNLYIPFDDHDYGDGNYNITIDCSDDLFATTLGYGDFNLSIDVEKDYYYNYTDWFIIDITGYTSLTATTIFPDPAIGYYNSDQIFNITVYFQDDGRTEGIEGGQLKIYVKNVSVSTYEEYTTVSVVDIGGGEYNITLDCSDQPFYPYNKYDIKINITKLHYYTATEYLEEIVVGNTTLTILEPAIPISYVLGEIFNITVEYEDHTLSSGIIRANITYTLNGTGYRNDKWKDNLNGTYTITINVSDGDFEDNYKDIEIKIRANKSYYINLTTTFTFERQITTQIKPYNNPPLIEVIRGVNATYTFNYTDRNNKPINRYDTFENIILLNGFQWHLWNNGSGYYTIELNTTNVIVIGSPYTLNFSIYAFGNQSQEISLSILVTIIETRIEVESWNENADFARSTDIDLIINFYFNDTTNNQPIENLTDSNIIVRNYATGDIWSPDFELFNRTGAGNYTLNIRTIGAPSGTYNLELSVSKFPNYDVSYQYFQFYLRGNFTKFNLISITDPGGALTSISSGHHYRIFEGSETNLVYNILDLEFNNNTVLQVATSYSIGYRNLNTGSTGTLQSNIQFVHPNHAGTINTSISELTAGNYLISVSTAVSNYETTSFDFNITIIEKYNVSIDVLDPPLEVTAGSVFNITILAKYYDGTDWLPLIGGSIVVTPYFDGVAGSPISSPIYTNSSGIYIFQIPTRTDATNISLVVEIPITYNHLGDTFEISNIKLNPAPSGLDFEDLLPYLIIIGAAVAATGGSFAVYRGVIVPKKREKARILTEVKTIFDDAINLEHVLVLYKGSGTCVYFKSFGSEQIDPELISGFISAISSFGKDLVSQ